MLSDILDPPAKIYIDFLGQVDYCSSHEEELSTISNSEQDDDLDLQVTIKCIYFVSFMRA